MLSLILSKRLSSTSAHTKMSSKALAHVWFPYRYRAYECAALINVRTRSWHARDITLPGNIGNKNPTIPSRSVQLHASNGCFMWTSLSRGVWTG
ncbi:hypothetical protein AG1IA_08486 [Rhizoctonia solani AG-1 IA]|uniref:Uncharacterized protein n=1 Tax=Thanatephorus cucumeris (strain AG1-IA) TaxID=983506 RepID=L8WKZ3_THACA|nr:hypothetical protein AG1IA_08486 [Rhizoctonia solani AG-1 IA]